MGADKGQGEEEKGSGFIVLATGEGKSGSWGPSGSQVCGGEGGSNRSLGQELSKDWARKTK